MNFLLCLLLAGVLLYLQLRQQLVGSHWLHALTVLQIRLVEVVQKHEAR